jgi:hypothetical protein
MFVRSVYLHNNDNCRADGTVVKEEIEVEQGVFPKSSAPVCAYCFCELERVSQRLRQRVGEATTGTTNTMPDHHM